MIRKRWFWVSLVLFLSLTVLGYLAWRELDRQTQQMVQLKLVYTSRGTIVNKTAGTVYYQIDNFDTLPEPRRSRAIEAEKERLLYSGPRSYHSVDWYDSVGVGVSVYVHYQCFSDGTLEIVNVDL